MSDLIDRQKAIDILDVDAELLKRVLDDTDVVGAERAKYEWGLGLIESYICDMKELPSAEPEWTLTTTEQPRKAGYYQSTCIDQQWGITANEAERYLSVCYYEPSPDHPWYDPRRGTVVAWMPLPEMYQGPLDEWVQAMRDEHYRRMKEEDKRCVMK